MYKPGSLLTVRHYAERLSAHFELEIQSDHFSNGRSLSIEGCSVEVSMNNSISRLQFYSHFSDNNRQDTSTTNAHMMKIMDNLKINNQEIGECTVWESTDGCSKQYCCGSALHLLSYISFKYKIIIDRMIGAAGHGKDIVDGINAIDKRYLKGEMCMIGTPEIVDCSKRIKAHSMIGKAYYSFLEECKRLCECSDRENRAKGYSKHKKREAECKIKQIFYYVQNKNDVMITELKNVIGMKSGKLMGVSARCTTSDQIQTWV